MRHSTRVLLLPLLAAACEQYPEVTRPPPPQGERPESVTVAAGQFVSGFRVGQLKAARQIEGFDIMRRPVTVRQFRDCVNARVCTSPPKESCAAQSEHPLDGPSYELGVDDYPVTCAGIAQAAQYCTWVGGKLPTFEQWQVAARGYDLRRFPWGDTEANCSQHALGQASPESDAKKLLENPSAAFPSCPQAGEEPALRFAVGRYPAGASSVGAEDVLLTRGELLRISVESLFPACASGRTGCIVYGLSPGAIDSVQPVEPRAAGEPERAPIAYGFRCVWSAS